MKKGGKPDPKTRNYDFSYKLPDFSTCKIGNDNIHVSDSQSDDAETLHIDPKNCAKDPYTVFVSNLDFNGHGEYCFGELLSLEAYRLFQKNLFDLATNKLYPVKNWP